MGVVVALGDEPLLVLVDDPVQDGYPAQRRALVGDDVADAVGGGGPDHDEVTLAEVGLHARAGGGHVGGATPGPRGLLPHAAQSFETAVMYSVVTPARSSSATGQA